jgi:uncharacterized protein YndB with AHSA1/START domain
MFPLTHTQTLSTSAPPETMWRAFESVRRWREGNPKVSRATLTPKGPLAPGSTIEVRAVGGSGGADRIERVVAAEPPSRLVLTIDETEYRATTEYRIATAADGMTEVTVTGTLDARGLSQTVRFLLWRQRLTPILSATMRERAQALIDLAERIALEEKR